MTYNSSQEFESFVPIYDVVPEEWEKARPFLVEQFKKLSDGINSREIGFLLDEELLTGKQFIPTPVPIGDASPPQFRSVLRKVIDFGPLPNAGLKSVPHGITFDANFTLIDLWAAATDPTNLQAVNIPLASPLLITQNISLLMDAVNVNIFTGSNVSSYTRCFIFIEYIQEI